MITLAVLSLSLLLSLSGINAQSWFVIFAVHVEKNPYVNFQLVMQLRYAPSQLLVAVRPPDYL